MNKAIQNAATSRPVYMRDRLPPAANNGKCTYTIESHGSLNDVVAQFVICYAKRTLQGQFILLRSLRSAWPLGCTRRR